MRLTLRLRPFGQGRPVAIIGVGLVVAAVAGAAAGWLYQNLLLSVPHAIVTFVIFAALPGVAIASLGFRMRCRSRALLLVLAACGGLAADIASWAVALRHAREHDLAWVESETEAFLRRSRLSKTATDLILGRHDIMTEEGRRAYREVANEPPVPERLSETVRKPTPLQYADFRLRRGWPERGHETSHLVVAVAWSGELVLFALVAAWAARLIPDSLRPRSCVAHGKLLVPTAVSLLDVDHAALAAAAARENIEEILAVPRWTGSGREGRFEIRRCPDGDIAVVSLHVHWKALGLDRKDVVLEDAVIAGDQADALRRRLEEEGARVRGM